MEKILSISIAAYNVSTVIKKCLDSFVSSKYIDIIELIVVDDGSKDNTASIVKEYEKQFPISIKLISKVNGGHGSTINTSLKLATGKYYKVVDGDDWIDTTEFDRLIEKLINLDVDLVISNYNEIYVNKIKKINIVNKYEIYKIYKFEDLNPKIYFPMHSLIVKTQTLKLVNEKISEHKFYVDSEYIFFGTIYAKTVVFFKEYVYQYRLGQEGQSVSPVSVYNHIEDLMDIIYRLLNIYDKEEKKIQSEIKKKYLFNLINVFYKQLYSWFLIMYKFDKYMELKTFDEKIRKEFPVYQERFNLGIYKLVPLNYYIVLKFARFLKPIQRKIKNILKL